MDIAEENKILKGLLKSLWENLDGTLSDRITSKDLGSVVRRAAVKFVNDKTAYSLEEAIKYAAQYGEENEMVI